MNAEERKHWQAIEDEAAYIDLGHPDAYRFAEDETPLHRELDVTYNARAGCVTSQSALFHGGHDAA